MDILTLTHSDDTLPHKMYQTANGELFHMQQSEHDKQ